MAEIYLSTGNVLPLFQSAEVERPVNVKVEFINQTLQLSQSVKVNPIRLTAQNQLQILQEVRNRSISLTVSNYLELHQNANRPKFLYVTNQLILTQSAKKVLHQIVGNTLTYNQSVNVSKGISQTLVFNQSVTINIIRSLNVAQVFQINQGVALYKNNDSSFIMAPPSAPIVYNPVSLTNGLVTVTLTIPEFGDVNNIEHHRIARESRGGDRIIYHDLIWPIRESLQLEFRDLSENQGKQLLNFLEDTLGTTITLIDHYGTTWSGIILNPDLEIEQEDGAECAGFATEIQFEGIIVNYLIMPEGTPLRMPEGFLVVP